MAFDFLGNLWDTLSGKTAYDANQKAQDQQSQLYSQGQDQASAGLSQEQAANQYLQKLYGMTPEQLYQQQAGDNAASSQMAGQEAGLASQGAAANAADSARSMGLNAGQAGLAGGQQVSGAYTNTFTPAFNQQEGQIQQNRNNQLGAAQAAGQQGNQLTSTGNGAQESAAGLTQDNSKLQAGTTSGVYSGLEGLIPKNSQPPAGATSDASGLAAMVPK